MAFYEIEVKDTNSGLNEYKNKIGGRHKEEKKPKKQTVEEQKAILMAMVKAGEVRDGKKPKRKRRK